MSGWGGKREGAGRKLSPLKSHKLTEEIIDRHKRQHGEGGFISPLDYLLAQINDETNPKSLRIDCAKAAAPYVHPKLQSITTANEEDNRLVIVFKDQFGDKSTPVVSNGTPVLQPARSIPLDVAVRAALADDDDAEDDAEAEIEAEPETD